MKRRQRKSAGLPVVPVPALSIGVLCEVGSEIEAGLGGLTPCALAGVGQALATRLSPTQDKGGDNQVSVRYLLKTCMV